MKHAFMALMLVMIAIMMILGTGCESYNSKAYYEEDMGTKLTEVRGPFITLEDSDGKVHLFIVSKKDTMTYHYIDGPFKNPYTQTAYKQED